MISVFIFCHFIVISRCVYLNNVDCGSYPDYIETNTLKNYQYFPVVVKLFRCRGADNANDLQFKKCTPEIDGIKNVIIDVRDSSGWQKITVQNHTSCHETCAINNTSCSPYQTFIPDDCTCICKYKDKPVPDPCKLPFRWEQSMCNCECSIESRVCEKEKEFSNKLCGCFCKLEYQMECAKRKLVLDEETCHCLNPTMVTGSIALDCQDTKCGIISAWVMAFEALVIVIMFLCFYFYCYKGSCFSKQGKGETENVKVYGSI